MLARARPRRARALHRAEPVGPLVAVGPDALRLRPPLFDEPARRPASPPLLCRRTPAHGALRAALVAALLAQDRVGVGALRPPRLLGPGGGGADARGLETRPCAAAPGPRGGGPQTAARARGAAQTDGRARVNRGAARGILATAGNVIAQTSGGPDATLRRGAQKPLKTQKIRPRNSFTKAVARHCPLCYTRADLGRAPLRTPRVPSDQTARSGPGAWGQNNRKGRRVRTSFDFRRDCRALCHGRFRTRERGEGPFRSRGRRGGTGPGAEGQRRPSRGDRLAGLF